MSLLVDEALCKTLIYRLSAAGRNPRGEPST
jgi:hypothetical protein